MDGRPNRRNKETFSSVVRLVRLRTGSRAGQETKRRIRRTKQSGTGPVRTRSPVVSVFGLLAILLRLAWLG